MPTFDEIQSGLQEARRQDEERSTALLRTREQVRKLERERAGLLRHAADEADPALAALAEREAALQAQLGELQGQLAEVQATERGWLAAFATFSDPREGIGQLPDGTPILLFPLRLETRFSRAADGQDQLLVRAYPDDCLVDSFEELLSEAEVEAGRRYRIDQWRAGDREDRERAAWRGIVGRFSSGRAAYILQQYVPVNPDDRPQPADPATVILVVAAEDALPAAEQGPLAEFWRAVYRAPDDPAAQDAASRQLAATVGAARAAELVAGYVAVDLKEEPVAPHTRADVPVVVAFLVLPPAAKQEATLQGWSQAPRVNLLPDRLVLLGYRGGEEVLNRLGAPIPRPLIVGPDPLAEPEDQLRDEDGELVVGPQMRWMVDFSEAVERGMAFVVDLTPEQARLGFDRLLVAGVRLSLDADTAAGRLEELLTHHRHSRKGFSLLPQGTPTNNTEDGDAGFDRSEDPDQSFEDLFLRERQFEPTTDWLTKRDGQWLAEWLGVDPGTFQHVRFAGGTDQSEARAMNRALWPATWGYFLETMMSPVLDQETIEGVRAFFNDHVLGRGAVPAIRIGRQPYGVLPTTAFSRVRWFEDTSPDVGAVGNDLLAGLYLLLRRVEQHWSAFSGELLFVGKPADGQSPQQVLLDIIGHHAGSVEFHQRYAESLEHLVNQLKLEGLGGLFSALILAGYVRSGQDLLAELGYTGEQWPDILGKVFLGGQNTLLGDLVDDQPLSETARVRSYTSDDRNYLRWLRDAAGTSHDALRRQQGFTDDRRPTALLYLMLQHALDLSFHAASLELHVAAELLTRGAAAELRREAPFVHLAEAARESESKWSYLYKTEPAITGRDDLLIGDYIPQVIGDSSATRYLSEQLRALEQLLDTPTARLERVLVEHLDTCGYRLDAWKAGLIHHRLAQLRFQAREDGGRRGIHLGAFGWLEDVRSEDKRLQPAAVPEDLRPLFQPEGSPPLMTDPSNGGYVHAPSLDHAVTAAILRNGYLSNATPTSPDLLAVNLSSQRARLAMGAIEGVRAGQPLGALLGYRFERHLHDAAAEVDAFIYPIRKLFPLVADHMADTRSGDGDAIERLEARNVVDGLALVEHIKATRQRAYPFGTDLPQAQGAQLEALNAAAEHLLELEDAVADLAVAEGVHQVVRGNLTRVGATLDSYSRGGFPPLPEVVQTPRGGTALTHRVGLQLDAAADPDAAPGGVPATPRSRTEPAVNTWLAGLLPSPDDVGCRVRYSLPGAGGEVEHDVSQRALGLQPIDLVYLLDPRQEPTLTALDDLVLDHVVHQLPTPPRPDERVTISYREYEADGVPFFELSPLLASIREVVLRSRPLRPTDVRLPHEVDADAPVDVSIDPARLQPALDVLGTQRLELQDVFLPTLSALLVDPLANEQAIIDAFDGLLDDWMAIAGIVGRCAVSQSGVGGVWQSRGAIYASVVERVAELVVRWDQRLLDHQALRVDAAAAPTVEGALLLLEEAERKISSEATTPRPPTVEEYLPALDDKRGLFTAKRDALLDLVEAHTTALAPLINGVGDALPLSAFDLTGLDIGPERRRVVTLAFDLQRQAETLAAELTRRIEVAQAKLAEAAAAAGPDQAVPALTDAARALLGEDFQILPRFRLPADQQAEWANAYQHRGDLLNHLQTQRDFPVDDWLYGLARVREKLWHWENLMLLSETFRGAGAALDAIQLPFRQPDYWLALEYPDHVLGTTEPFVLDEDKLLYTAHYAEPFTAAGNHCGLLVDEWNETIPDADEDTGFTFHYDRPNSEPPQALLLALPTRFQGRWQWADLVDALHETLDMARLRAIEPRHVDRTAYARFLPATVTAVTFHPLTIALNYAMVNNVADALEVRDAD
jgi:hypothetical protein